MSDNSFYMKKALELAQIAFEEDEVPIGAVVVRNGEIVGIGYNKRDSQKNAMLHAETIAIYNACERLGGWRLWECDLYVTVEPCPMCTGAIINSRIRNLYFGAKNPKAGACGSIINLFDYPFNHKPNITVGLLEDECSKIMTDFFLKVREKRKKEKEAKKLIFEKTE